MKISSPSLQGLEGQRNKNNQEKITIIRENNYLRNIREDLTEEESHSGNQQNNQIIFITATLQGVLTDVMIDTGANVSLSDQVGLNRIKEIYNEYTNTANKQHKDSRSYWEAKYSNEKCQEGNMIPMVFVVTQELPFKEMTECKRLRLHSTVIVMGSSQRALYLSLIHI